MGDPTSGTVFQADDSGLIAEHTLPTVRPFFASPTREVKQNAISQAIVPMACLNLGDVLFEFDSSVVLDEAGRILSQLPALRASRPSANGDLPLVSIFGHADPTGDEVYNKALAGRRAKAVFALLTHDAAAWDELFRQPFGGDDWSKKMGLAVRTEALGLPASTPRQQTFLAIMQAMCPVPLLRADFLGRGADAKGKADFQGCGEFNPLLLLSADELKTLSNAQRNTQYVVDRRVVVFLFKPEIRLDVANWPCPRASEGPVGCRKRFFVNAASRLTPGPARKRHKGPLDETFACRFYDIIAGNSPCERILETYRVRLFDKQATPLPGALFTLTDGKRVIKGRAGADAFLTVRDIKVPADVHVEWQRAPGGETFSMDVHVDIEDADVDAAARRRLHNLGYEGHSTPAEDVRAFQKDHAARFDGMQPNGVLDAVTRDALEQINAECDPSVRSTPAALSGQHLKQGDKLTPQPSTNKGGA